MLKRIFEKACEDFIEILIVIFIIFMEILYEVLPYIGAGLILLYFLSEFTVPAISPLLFSIIIVGLLFIYLLIRAFVEEVEENE